MNTSPHRSDRLAALVRLESLRSSSRPCARCDERRAQMRGARRHIVATARTVAFVAVAGLMGLGAAFTTATLLCTSFGAVPGALLVFSGLFVVCCWGALGWLARGARAPEFDFEWRCLGLWIIGLCAVAPIAVLLVGALCCGGIAHAD